MKVDIRSLESCYINIGKHTIYLEVSQATENLPYISYWDTENEITMSHKKTGIQVFKL